jgi:uncharacterized membrane protein
MHWNYSKLCNTVLQWCQILYTCTEVTLNYATLYYSDAKDSTCTEVTLNYATLYYSDAKDSTCTEVTLNNYETL